MARLRDEEWLHLAKATPVNGTTRHPHPGDRTNRPNLIVHNKPDCWTAYCQSCKRGGRIDKTHVRYVGRVAPRTSTDLTLPSDKRLVVDLMAHEAHPVLAFLARKNMDMLQLPAETYFSESRQRLLLHTEWGWLGRDITELSHQKWLTYNGSHFLGNVPEGAPVIVVEDPFSYFKVRWATEHAVACALGVQVRDRLLMQLIKSSFVLFMFDGDGPGEAGALASQKRLRAFGVPCDVACAPTGFDPKDMSKAQIIQHITEAYGRTYNEGARQPRPVPNPGSIHAEGHGNA